MSFQNEPADPLGNESWQIYERQLKRWIRSNMVLDIKGAKRTAQANGGVAYELPPNPPIPSLTVPATMFPFKIYQVANVTATAAQRKVFTDLGLNIDDYTVQIRSGIVSDRPYLNFPADSFSGYAWGNYEEQVPCENTDFPPGLNPPDYYYYPPTPNSYGSSIIVDNVNDTLVCGVPKGSPANTNPVFNAQIVINPGVEGYDQFQNSSASFWIEIVDDINFGLYANLMARMLSYDPPSFRNAYFFPSGPRIIPIGIYGLFANYSVPDYFPLIPFWQQMQSGNLVNRFPPLSGNQRGAWGDIFNALPAGATKSVFYPGDIVIDDQDVITENLDVQVDAGAGVVELNYYGIYMITEIGFYQLSDTYIFRGSSLTKRIGQYLA